jgi:hypothetical protein
MVISLDVLRRLSADLRAEASTLTQQIKSEQENLVASWSINQMIGRASGISHSADFLDRQVDALWAEYSADKAEHEHAGDCHASDFPR